jgi:hypothetical protein
MVIIQGELGRRAADLRALKENPPSTFDDLLSDRRIPAILDLGRAGDRRWAQRTDTQLLGHLLGYGRALTEADQQVREHFSGLPAARWKAAVDKLCTGVIRRLEQPNIGWWWRDVSRETTRLLLSRSDSDTMVQGDLEQTGPTTVNLSGWDAADLVTLRDEMFLATYRPEARIPFISLTLGLTAALFLAVGAAVSSRNRWVRGLLYLMVLVLIFAPAGLITLLVLRGGTPSYTALLPYAALLLAVAAIMLVAFYQENRAWLHVSLWLLLLFAMPGLITLAAQFLPNRALTIVFVAVVTVLSVVVLGRIALWLREGVRALTR